MLRPARLALLTSAVLAAMLGTGLSPVTERARAPAIRVDDWYAYAGRGITGYLHVVRRPSGDKLAPVLFVHEFAVKWQGEVMSLHLETLCRDDAYYTPIRITSKGEGDEDEFGNFVADIEWRKTPKGMVGALKTAVRGRDRELALPERTTTLFAMFEIAKRLPLKKDNVFKFHALEASELNLKEDQTLSYVGDEEIEFHGETLTAHKFEHRDARRLVTELWFSKKRELVRVRIDEDKEMVLTTKQDATGSLE